MHRLGFERTFYSRNASQHWINWPIFQRNLFSRRSNTSCVWSCQEGQLLWIEEWTCSRCNWIRASYTKHQRAEHCDEKQRNMGPFFHEKPMITGIKCPALKQNSTLEHSCGNATSHFSRRICASLDRKFPDGCLGWAGPITWHLSSPDLNTLTSSYYNVYGIN
jgi:hypothetical protein